MGAILARVRDDCQPGALQKDMPAIILDGQHLAARRAPLLAARAHEVARRRSAPPSLLIVAFAEPDGNVRHVQKKIRACAQAGVDVQRLLFPHHTASADAVAALRNYIAAHASDGVFLQFPFPAQIDGDALAAEVPEERDVDVMTPARIQRYFRDYAEAPPVTVSAAHLLLDEYDLSIAGLEGVVIADASPFAEMFSESMARRGARMQPLLAPDDASLEARLRAAQLVIVAAAQPGVVKASQLAHDAVAIDVGYFNPAARGDIDTAAGIDHLRAIIPVPGGIGPMTVSALIERVIAFAEKQL
jgi:methylenetetrahydrofolate dehydrogenase (NADP+)/methenyltetrahydrofolate cyclohydrolase